MTNEKTSMWEKLFVAIIFVTSFKLFGVLGGVVSIICYYSIKPRLGSFVAGVIALIVAFGATLLFIKLII